MSGGGESLSKHLYDAAKGDVKTAQITLDSDATWETIITPASGKKICILYMLIQPKSASCFVFISFFNGGTEDASGKIVRNMNMPYITPVSLNVEKCPIVGTEDYLLKGKAPAGANAAEVYINYLEI